MGNVFYSALLTIQLLSNQGWDCSDVRQIVNRHNEPVIQTICTKNNRWRSIQYEPVNRFVKFAEGKSN